MLDMPEERISRRERKEIRKREKKEKVKNIIKLMVCIFLIPLVIYNLVLITKLVKNPKETPDFFGIKSYVIISGSMEPEISIGDLVIVKDVNGNKLEEGDVISYRRGQSVITHRIQKVVKVDGEYEYVTKGDNNNVEDIGNITEEQIEGKVILKIKYIGNVLLFLKNKVVITLIMISLYVFIIYEQTSAKRKNKKGRRSSNIHK